MSENADPNLPGPSCVYVCPRTRGKLVWHRDTQRREGGAGAYDAPDGIPSFLRYEPVEDRRSLEQMK
jgi:uncharacterized protein YbaR (Trm112 family)